LLRLSANQASCARRDGREMFSRSGRCWTSRKARQWFLAGFGAQPWTSHVALAECILAYDVISVVDAGQSVNSGYKEWQGENDRQGEITPPRSFAH